MTRRNIRACLLVLLTFTNISVLAQQQQEVTPQSLLDQRGANPHAPVLSAEGTLNSLGKSAEDSAGQRNSAIASAPAKSSGESAATPPKAAPAPADPHKLGRLNVSVNWRFRTEAWDRFQPATGQNAYAFEHSLLRIGIGQKSEVFEWMLEGAQDAIVDLPTRALQPGRPGQLGLGATYFAANSNGLNNANGFVKQAYLGFKLPANGRLRLGRFGFLDGAEVIPKDKSLATLVSTGIAQRLIGDFGFSAVGRSFDGVQLAFNTGSSNFTLFGARPTRGVYQIDGVGELDVDLFYGACAQSRSLLTTAPENSASFRSVISTSGEQSSRRTTARSLRTLPI